MSEDSIWGNLLQLYKNPIKLAIWLEIQFKDGITAKEISENLQMKGTNIYYYLKQLEKSKLIISSTHQIESFNLLQRKYQINPSMFTELEFNEKKKIDSDESLTKARILSNLYITAFYHYRAITQISKFSDEEVQELIGESKGFFSSISFITKDDFDKVRDKFIEFQDSIFEIMNETERDPVAQLQDSTEIVTLGLFPYMKKDKSSSS